MSNESMSNVTGPDSGPLATVNSHPVLRRWPAVLGLAAAILSLAIGASRDGVATTVGVAALCYLAAAALVGFGGAAVAGLFIAPRAGLVLAAIALASHAVWDVIHYRRRQVVPRSLAEFCFVLDVPLSVGAIIPAVT